jgi:hypothetical protein
MPSERIRRQIDRLLDQAEEATERKAWAEVRELAQRALALDAENAEARAIAAMAAEELGTEPAPESVESGSSGGSQPAPSASFEQPASFAGGRYEVRRFLGEGGKKKVYLAHDASLDRDVSFALIKTEGLDATGRERITREAQAMGRLGAHPHIVTIFEIGDEGGSPYVVNELLAGGDVEGELEAAEGRCPSCARSRSRRASVAGSSSPTSAASCIATSSRATSGSPRTAPPRSATSASPSRSTVRGSRSTG